MGLPQKKTDPYVNVEVHDYSGAHAMSLGELMRMADSIAAQNEIIADLRNRPFPVSVDLLIRPKQSPALRNGVGIDV